jgi:putative redox protein
MIQRQNHSTAAIKFIKEIVVEATVSLDHGMTFIGRSNSGFSVQMGTSPSVGGDDDGPRPMELLLMSLGGCTAMDVISILRKKRQEVTGFDVQLKAERSGGHPNVFTKIDIHYVVRGHNIADKAVARALELSETKYCPAQAMLSESVAIDLTYEIIEEEQEPVKV